MADHNPIKDLFEPLSGRSEGRKGTGLTPDTLTAPPRDTLSIRAGTQKRPLPPKLIGQERGIPDEGWG